MEQYGNNDTPDLQEKRMHLYEQLRIYDETIHNLEEEIASAEQFIDDVADSTLDKKGLVQSMGVSVLRQELKEIQKKQAGVFEEIRCLEARQFGEEIPRGKDGKPEMPWEKIYLLEVEKEINALFSDDT
ncbi:hypothetical protein GF369_03475 [Candidatus Peregrinibacteria bacterium]|nr:hypothetical protein [Candidatus Peregrinibacteria bacterium]